MWGILTVAERRSLRMTMGKVGLLVIILNYNAQFPFLPSFRGAKTAPTTKGLFCDVESPAIENTYPNTSFRAQSRNLAEGAK